MRSRVVSSIVPLLISIGLLAPNTAHALGFEWLRSENDDVTEGNERLKAGDAKAALGAYERAARQLPAEAGVHLNRGLALLAGGELGKARDALRLAVQPPASNAVRADAYHDLGIGFYREADARAAENKHDEAQQLFREAADSFKHALRLRPGERDTAWNYELAKRRVTEQQDAQKQQEQKKQDEQKQDEQKQDEQQADNQEAQQNQPDGGQGDPPEDSQQPQDEQSQKPEQSPAQEPQQKDTPQQQAENQKKPADEGQADERAPEAQPDPQAPDAKLSPEVARALDALEDGEENLERVRALNRAARERRAPEKDW
jgi:Ca-activated chloride channel homolog